MSFPCQNSTVVQTQSITLKSQSHLPFAFGGLSSTKYGANSSADSFGRWYQRSLASSASGLAGLLSQSSFGSSNAGNKALLPELGPGVLQLKQSSDLIIFFSRSRSQGLKVRAFAWRSIRLGLCHCSIKMSFCFSVALDGRESWEIVYLKLFGLSALG